jgi:predicted N-acetyltransferase YhbS
VPEAENDALREAAAHRGMKLVKSRKRKAGFGDYGRFGLTDGSGKELFGFDEAGLTATAADILDYLRKAEVSTWAQSAEVTPDHRMPSSMEREPDALTLKPSSENKALSAAGADNAKRAAHTKGPSKSAKRTAGARTARQEVDASAPVAAQPEYKPEPVPEPELSIRAAAKADIEAISRMTGPVVSVTDLAVRICALQSGGGGALVAERGGIIGCAAWCVILGLQNGPVGRITLLLVAEDERRRGLGSALVKAASSAMAEQGCSALEVMSDIELRNVNGFYRAVGFQQKSYRFLRATTL